MNATIFRHVESGKLVKLELTNMVKYLGSADLIMTEIATGEKTKIKGIADRNSTAKTLVSSGRFEIVGVGERAEADLKVEAIRDIEKAVEKKERAELKRLKQKYEN